MAISLSAPRTTELKPRIVVFGVGGAGGNAVNNMIEAGLEGVEFVVANTDAQQLQFAKTDRRIQLGISARVNPWIDLFSGDLEQRGTLNGAVNYTVDRTTFRGYLGTGQVFNTPRSVAKYSIVLGEGGIRYRISPIFSVDTGVRYGYQDFDNAVRFSTTNQFTIFGGLFLAPLPARF